MSVEVRGQHVWAQYLAGRARLEPSEPATKVAWVGSSLFLLGDPGSFLFAGTVGIQTDCGGASLVAALTRHPVRRRAAGVAGAGSAVRAAGARQGRAPADRRRHGPGAAAAKKTSQG